MTDVGSSGDIRERIRRIVADTFGVPLAEIGEDTSSDQIEDWDSIAQLNLALAIEGEFGIKFSAEELMDIVSVRVAESLVREKTAEIVRRGGSSA